MIMPRLFLSCALLALAPSCLFGQSWQSAFHLAGLHWDYVYDVAVDADGYFYVAGRQGDSCHFNGTAIPYHNTVAVGFVAKMDTLGNMLWLDVLNDARPLKIAVNATGEPIVGGRIGWNFVHNGDTVPEEDGRLFMLKYDANGNRDWFQQLGHEYAYAPNSHRFGDIAVDNAGNVLVAIDIWDSTYFDGQLVSPYDGTDVLSKWTPSGNMLWVTPVNGPLSSVKTVYAIDVDDEGNTYMTGRTRNTAYFGSDSTVTPNHCVNAYLCKIGPKGHVLWARSDGFASDCVQGQIIQSAASYDVAVDDYGHVYTCGSFMDEGMIGTTPVTAPGPYQNAMYIACHDADGNVLWAAQAVGGRNTNGYHLTTDHCGAVYLAMGQDSTCEVAGQVLPSVYHQTQRDLSIVKFDSLGTLEWATTQEGELFGALVLQPNEERLWLGGYFENELNLGIDSLSSVDRTDGILLSMSNVVPRCPWLGVGLSEGPQNQGIRAFPNPFQQQFQLELPPSVTGRIDVQLFNLTGRQCLVRQLQASTTITMDAGELPTGLYLLRVSQNGVLLGAARLLHQR